MQFHYHQWSLPLDMFEEPAISSLFLCSINGLLGRGEVTRYSHSNSFRCEKSANNEKKWIQIQTDTYFRVMILRNLYLSSDYKYLRENRRNGLIWISHIGTSIEWRKKENRFISWSTRWEIVKMCILNMFVGKLIILIKSVDFWYSNILEKDKAISQSVWFSPQLEVQWGHLK